MLSSVPLKSATALSHADPSHTRLNALQPCRAKESARTQKVVQHPLYQQDPIQAITNHLNATLPPAPAPPPMPKPGGKRKKKGGKKNGAGDGSAEMEQ